MTETYLLEHALLDGGVVVPDVLVTLDHRRFTEVTVLAGSDDSRTPTGGDSSGRATPGEPQVPPGTSRIPGLTIPGLANTHSHAFHRALRGRTQTERGSFWTWREQMYGVAERLTPDSYHALARATYAEMAAAGISCVGEFHYLHHQPDGTPYDEPNAMGEAVVSAARDAGVRITLLDTCYVSAGFGAPVSGVQRRFSDGDAGRWAERRDALARLCDGVDGVVVGAAIHSVRAVPRAQIATVVAAADGTPLHAHLSEQVAENDACYEAYRMTPTEVLDDAGALGPRTTAVHATHLTERDMGLLGAMGCFASFCPTTERDLADGFGPATALARVGSRLTLGSDSHAVIDLFEEMRAVEMHERLVTEQRGHWSAAELVAAATVDGHASLGFADAGRIAVGQRADLVTLDLASARTAGTGGSCESVVFAATAADVRRVVVDGRLVFDGDTEAVGSALHAAIGQVQP